MDRIVQLESALASLIDAVKDYHDKVTPALYDRLEVAANDAEKVLNNG